MSSSLLDPSFLSRLKRLRLAVRRRFAGAASGTRRSTRRGSSAEFADHRPYYHGDDVRRIDWNAYARLEELVLRLYVAEEDLSVYFLLDTSASLGQGEPPKIELAKKLAAGLGYVGLVGSERVSVVPFAGSTRTAQPPLPPMRGQRRVGTLLRYLDEVRCEGGTDLGRSVEELLARKPRPGLVVVLSDFLDPGGYQRPLDRLLGSRFEPALFQILSPEELSPVLGGDHVLVDSEHGGEVEVSLDARTVEAYRARLERFLSEIEGYAKKRGLFYGRTSTEADFEELLMRYLRAA